MNVEMVRAIGPILYTPVTDYLADYLTGNEIHHFIA